MSKFMWCSQFKIGLKLIKVVDILIKYRNESPPYLGGPGDHSLELSGPVLNVVQGGLRLVHGRCLEVRGVLKVEAAVEDAVGVRVEGDET